MSLLAHTDLGRFLGMEAGEITGRQSQLQRACDMAELAFAASIDELQVTSDQQIAELALEISLAGGPIPVEDGVVKRIADLTIEGRPSPLFGALSSTWYLMRVKGFLERGTALLQWKHGYSDISAVPRQRLVRLLNLAEDFYASETRKLALGRRGSKPGPPTYPVSFDPAASKVAPSERVRHIARGRAGDKPVDVASDRLPSGVGPRTGEVRP